MTTAFPAHSSCSRSLNLAHESERFTVTLRQKCGEMFGNSSNINSCKRLWSIDKELSVQPVSRSGFSLQRYKSLNMSENNYVKYKTSTNALPIICKTHCMVLLQF